MFHTQPNSHGGSQRLIALSHQKLEYLSYLPVDAPVLLRSVLIFNAIQVAESAGNAQRLREEEWFENTLGQLDSDEGDVSEIAPGSMSVPSPASAHSSESSAIVQVQEVDDDDDESDLDDEEMSSLTGSVDSLLSFTMEDTEHNHAYPTTSPPPSRPASPRHSPPPQLFLPLPVAKRPTSIVPFDDLSDDDDGPELVTPPQPALLDDFDTPCDGHSTDDFGWNAERATQGLQLFI
ncbi:hypothetical protein [Phaffia rhodozyma]|uniref:Uncharacterized protein n=1 Tax=Phaffia rhodozyma TaxID=264483 RepID=A0A0F7SW61_PHARH|nr:hypothetical protein [Phaffia rhodozyma]